MKIKLKPLSEQNTSVSISVAYTDRLQEALVGAVLLLFFFPAIIGFHPVVIMVWRFIFWPLLIGLAITPHIITKPLVQEVASLIGSSEGISDNSINQQIDSDKLEESESLKIG